MKTLVNKLPSKEGLSRGISRTRNYVNSLALAGALTLGAYGLVGCAPEESNGGSNSGSGDSGNCFDEIDCSTGTGSGDGNDSGDDSGYENQAPEAIGEGELSFNSLTGEATYSVHFNDPDGSIADIHPALYGGGGNSYTSVSSSAGSVEVTTNPVAGEYHQICASAEDDEGAMSEEVCSEAFYVPTEAEARERVDEVLADLSSTHVEYWFDDILQLSDGATNTYPDTLVLYSEGGSNKEAAIEYVGENDDLADKLEERDLIVNDGKGAHYMSGVPLDVLEEEVREFANGGYETIQEY